MIRLFPARQRAERFDSLVEGGRRNDVDRTTSDLLEVVGALRSMPEASARPEFVADLRERLMLAAQTELAVAKPDRARSRDEVARLTVKPSRTRRERRIGVLVGAAAIIGATTSMAVASQSAIPGDALYPVKRALENTEAGFSISDEAKGETILGDASGRLDEVDELTSRSKPDAKLVTQTLQTFSDQATQAGDHLMADYEQNGHEASIESLHEFTEQSVTELSSLEASVPPDAHPALLEAAQAVFALDAAALNLCPDCGDGLTELPAQLLAGAAATLDGVTNLLAGGGLSGTPPAEATPSESPQNGVKGPSGLNPPETPITIPSSDPTTSPGDTGGGGLGELLPTGGTQTSDGDNDGGNGGGSGGGNGGNGGGSGGKGGTTQTTPPLDLTPVTDTVTEVVTGVVQGVTGLLSGLIGGQGASGNPTP